MITKIFSCPFLKRFPDLHYQQWKSHVSRGRSISLAFPACHGLTDILFCFFVFKRSLKQDHFWNSWLMPVRCQDELLEMLFYIDLFVILIIKTFFFSFCRCFKFILLCPSQWVFTWDMLAQCNGKNKDFGHNRPSFLWDPNVISIVQMTKLKDREVK